MTRCVKSVDLAPARYKKQGPFEPPFFTAARIKTELELIRQECRYAIDLAVKVAIYIFLIISVYRGPSNYIYRELFCNVIGPRELSLPLIVVKIGVLLHILEVFEAVIRQIKRIVRA